VPHEQQNTADYLQVPRKSLSALVAKAGPFFYGTWPII
jgi:hypothetical protein